MLKKKENQRFYPERLNYHSELSWAVIGHPTGAIAINASGELLIRLSQQDARRLSAEMTRQTSSGAANAQQWLTMWPADAHLPKTA